MYTESFQLRALGEAVHKPPHADHGFTREPKVTTRGDVYELGGLRAKIVVKTVS